MAKSSDVARYAPFALGALALAVGLVLAGLPELSDRSGEAGTQGTPDGGGPEAGLDGGDRPDGAVAPQPPRPERYVPDLSGEDVGQLVVAKPRSSHGLVVAAGQLVWLTTEAATVFAAPLAGGAARPIFRSPADEAFGGSLVATQTKLCWSVERADGGAESIVCLPKQALGEGEPAPKPVITEGSPGHLTARGDDLLWVDQGVIMTLPAGQAAPQVVLDRRQLIAGLVVAGERLAWLEVPYESATRGGHAVMAVASEGDDAQPRTLARPVAGHHRELLVASGAQPYWVEGKEQGPWWLVTVAGGTTRKLTETGAVTALASAEAALYWAELHGEGDATVTLLRSLTLPDGKPQRLGRDSGPVPALTVHDGALFWATSQGIKRLALAE